MSLEQAPRPGIVRKLTLAFIVAAAVLAAGAAYFAWQQLAPPAVPDATGASPAAAAASSQPPAPAVSATRIGDWLVLCDPPQADVAGCVLQQTLRSRDSNQIVLVWTIRKDGSGAYRTSFMVPADVDRGKGLVLDLGDGRPRGVPFASCGQQTCEARAVLASDYLQLLQGASRIVVAVVVPSRPQPLVLGLSAAGLADALAKL